jgi:hypothetical protein
MQSKLRKKPKPSRIPDIIGKRRLFVEQRRTKKAVSPALAENRTDLARFLLIELHPIAGYYVDW